MSLPFFLPFRFILILPLNSRIFITAKAIINLTDSIISGCAALSAILPKIKLNPNIVFAASAAAAPLKPLFVFIFKTP